MFLSFLGASQVAAQTIPDPGPGPDPAPALTGYGSDDINKFLWMVRIGGGVDDTIREEQYFSKAGDFRVDQEVGHTQNLYLPPTLTLPP